MVGEKMNTWEEKERKKEFENDMWVMAGFNDKNDEAQDESYKIWLLGFASGLKHGEKSLKDIRDDLP